MADLTLEQVLKAGREAFIEDDTRHYHYHLGDDDFCPATIAVSCGSCGCVLDIDCDPEPGDKEMPGTGWYHLPGCDCEFCRE
jgi:hypothetical protein